MDIPKSEEQIPENSASQASRSNPFPISPSVLQSEGLDYPQTKGLVCRKIEPSPRASENSAPLLIPADLPDNDSAGEEISHLFMIYLEPFAIIMQHQSLEEEVLRAKLSKVMSLLDEHKGAVAAELTSPWIKCNNALCRREYLALEMCAMGKCGHVFCKECFNQSLLKGLSEVKTTTGTPQFLCFICLTKYNVLDCPLEDLVYPQVMDAIRERVLINSSVSCPYCRDYYDASTLSGPCIVHCTCGRKFCSYCLKPKHYFNCSQWVKDQKGKRKGR